MWSKILTILPILAALPCYGTRAKKIQQPELDDAQVFEDLADGPVDNDDSVSDGPPVKNYDKLRQRNAEMVKQVEKLTVETHQLKHKFKVTKLQEKTAISKIMKKCPTGMHRLAPAHTHDGVKMPWSLTHTATRHKQKKGSWFPGEEAFRGLYNHFKALSGGIPTSSRSYASAGTAGQLHRDVIELKKEMQQTHVRLGRVEEMKGTMDAHLQALKTKVADMEAAATRDQQQLDDLTADEQNLDQQLLAFRNA